MALVSRPFVEYKGTVPQNELQNKQKELELEVNTLISKGGKVSSNIWQVCLLPQYGVTNHKTELLYHVCYVGFCCCNII